MVTIVQCVNNLDLGGVEQLVLALARALQKRGFRSEICCIEDRGALAAQAEASGARVVDLQMAQRGKWGALRAYCRHLRQLRPVVIHSHNFKPFYYSALATLLGAADGHIHTRHGAFIQHHRALWRYRLLRRGVDRIVSVTADRRDELARLAGLPSDQIVVLLNGIDTETFTPGADKPRLRIELGLPVEGPAIIVVARLAPEKDLGTLLRAFAIVRQTLPTAELWLVGDGPERATLESRSREYGVASHTRFLGQRADVPRFLQAADVFALSSLSEGLSVALIEAAACGLPIVATDVGGNSQVVNAPAGGRLVPAKQPQALAAALLEVLGNESLRREMSQAARRHACATFSEDQMVDGYAALYQQALQSRGRWGTVISDL